MNTFQIAGGVLLLVISVIIIVSVLMQDQPRAGSVSYTHLFSPSIRRCRAGCWPCS